MTGLLVIIILIVLIVAHEFGHFIAAKLSGVKVEEFGVGYPPRAFLLGTLSGTEYTINWLPFGGFVRLFGDQGESQRGRGSFVDAKKWKQALILVAGVLMNVLVAWLLFTGAIAVGIPRAVDTIGPNTQLLITEVVPGSPAETVGIEPGDVILGAVDENGVQDNELTPAGIAAFIATRGGQQITFTLLSNGATTTATVIPANAVIPGEASTPGVGIALVLVTSSRLSLPAASLAAFGATLSAFQSVGGDVWMILKSTLQGAPNLGDVVGPVGLISVVSEAAQAGIGQVLALAAFVSVNLAIINLIPIPALDGGRLVVIIAESIARRRAPILLLNIVNIIGVFLIFALMAIVTYHDIARLLT